MSSLSDKVSLSIDDDILRLLGFHPTTLITTIGKDGSINVAPMGWVTGVDYNPPQFLFSVNIKHDTYRNVLETGEFVVNIPSVDMIKEIWITQKRFPYGTNELEESKLTAILSEKVKPPRIKECKAHIECKVLWTKNIGSTCLVLGRIEAISISKELEKLNVKEQAIALKRPIFFSYKREEKERKWMFAQMGKVHTLTEMMVYNLIKQEIMI